MATDDSKPLPDIPDTPVTTLSVSARAHRAKFIRWLMQNEANLEEDYREEWSSVFEDALDALGESVSQGRWLSSAWDRKRPAGVQSSGDETYHAGAQTEHVNFSSLESAKALQGMRARTSALPSPTVTGSKHLVLCLSGPSRLTNDEYAGFDFIASNIGCVFRSEYFNASDHYASFLYGRDTWVCRSDRGESVQL